MPDYIAQDLAERLVKSGRAFTKSLAAAQNWAVLERDDTDPITPKGETPKRLRLIIAASDEGRHIKGAPIRNLRLTFMLRGNAKTETGDAEGMQEAGAAMEELLDGTNLKTALDSLGLGVRVMLATRRPGVGFQRQGMIRAQHYQLEVRAVRAELCA